MEIELGIVSSCSLFEPCMLQIIRLLLAAGSETDVCEAKSHQSPLFAAVSQQFTEAVNMLIEAGTYLAAF